MIADGAAHATCDSIVVGAGASGSTVAGRLSEDPGLRVLVLEAGPSDLGPDSRYQHRPGMSLAAHRQESP
jgi:choline dehydrogenase-like flavoprotein